MAFSLIIKVWTRYCRGWKNGSFRITLEISFKILYLNFKLKKAVCFEKVKVEFLLEKDGIPSFWAFHFYLVWIPQQAKRRRFLKSLVYKATYQNFLCPSNCQSPAKFWVPAFHLGFLNIFSLVLGLELIDTWRTLSFENPTLVNPILLA